MAKLHHASTEQLQFLGEMITLMERIQSNPRDSADMARDWITHALDALADLADCHDELAPVATSLRDIARREGGAGQEDTDGEGEDAQPASMSQAA